jgi:hypothetical protein
MTAVNRPRSNVVFTSRSARTAACPAPYVMHRLVACAACADVPVVIMRPASRALFSPGNGHKGLPGCDRADSATGQMAHAYPPICWWRMKLVGNAPAGPWESRCFQAQCVSLIFIPIAHRTHRYSNPAGFHGTRRRRTRCPARFTRPARFAGSAFRAARFSTCTCVKTTHSETVPPNPLTTIPVAPERPGAAHPTATTWYPARPVQVVRR